MISIERLDQTEEPCDGCEATPGLIFKIAFDARNPAKDVNAVRLCAVCKHVLACRLN